MAIKQLTVFVQNKKGTVVSVTEILSKNNINLRALSIAETQDFGILRLIVNDEKTAEKVLSDAGYLIKVIDDIEAGKLTRTKQDDALATYAKKIEKEECKLDFSMPAKRLDCIIRGLTPIPGAFALHNGKMLKIYRATPVDCEHGKVGEVVDINAKGEGSFTVKCGEGALLVTGVIPEGKGRMSAGDFIRGRKIALQDILE